MVRKFRPYAAVLGLSIAVNLYLWFDRDRVARQVSSATASVSHAGEARSNTKSDPAQLGSVSREPERRVATTSSDNASAPSCETQLSLARAQLTMLRSELGDRLTLMERFDRGKKDATSDRRFRSHIERIFKDAGISSWELECRDQICKVHALTEEGDQMEWLRQISQDKEMRGEFKSYQALGGSPDAGEKRKWDDAVFQLNPEDEAMATRALNRLLESFKASSALPDCTNGYQTSGTFEVLALLGESGLSYRFGGTLVDTPAGRCIADRLQAAGAMARMPPPPAREARAMARFRSPPEP